MSTLPGAALSTALLRQVFDISPNAITLSHLDSGELVSVNAAMARLCGQSPEALLGRTADQSGLWTDPADRQRLVSRVLAEGSVSDFATLWRHADGQPVSVLLSASSFVEDGRHYLVTLSSDVTDRERRRLQFEAMLNHAMVGIVFTRDDRFQSANACCERMFGWPAGALAGQPDRVLWPDRTSHEAFGRRVGPALARGEAVEAELELQRADGSRLWCALRARAVDPVNPADGGTIWILEDITERRRAQQALAAAKEEAEAANRAKSAFLANTSHEIRTPLSGLLGLVRLALAPDASPERQRDCLLRIQDSAETLAGTISDILDLSRIEAGKLSLDPADIDLHNLLAGVQRSYATLAEAKGLALHFLHDEALPRWVRCDPVRLRQILGNFLGNALKFTQDGQIRVRASLCAPARLRLEVEDTGPGIPREVQQRLFRPFTQADDSVTRRFGGSGLGLSICHQLAQLMGGAVGVHSAAGLGARFWAELPFAPGRPLPVIDADFQRSTETLRGARVLLVEDDPVNAMITEAALQQWGVQVQLAGNGRDALAACTGGRAQRFDALLMDLHMPEMGGTEAASRLRTQHSADTLPIIALSAGVLVSQRDAALASGMNDFLSKPIDLPRLAAVLSRWITVARTTRAPRSAPPTARC